MGVTVRKDLLIAAVIAVAIHAGASLITIHGRYITPIRENKINRNLEISFVSTYKEVEKIEPVIKKKRKIQPVVTPLKKEVKKAERKEQPVEPVEKINVEEQPVESVTQEVRETVQVMEEEPVWTGSAEEVTILPADPQYSKNPPPPYPPVARRRGYEGVVILSVQVLADGTVGELGIKDTSGYSSLDEAALKSVKKWTFKPAFRGKVPISMWVEVPVRFLIK